MPPGQILGFRELENESPRGGRNIWTTDFGLCAEMALNNFYSLAGGQKIKSIGGRVLSHVVK